jgi:hypothetical protein
MHYVLEVHALFYKDMLDSYMAGDKDSRRSTDKGMLFTIGGTTES